MMAANGDYQQSYGGAPRGDDDGKKIFVGGLSWETTADDMRDYFGKYGSITDCTLKTDPVSGRSRGFGFVLFEDVSSVDKALANRMHTLHGKTIDPKRAKARGSGGGGVKKVFVGGLDPTVSEEEIREYFGQFGTIEELSLPYDKERGQRRAFAFITFESEDVVDTLCKQPQPTLGGKPVDVKKATPKGSGNDGGFGGRGGGRGGGGFGGGRGGGFGGGRGRGRGGYDSSGYDNSGGYEQQDYSQSYGGDASNAAAYGNYDYSSYYGNQGAGGWGGAGYGQDSSQQSYGGGEYDSSVKRSSHGYHPYNR